MSLYIAWTCFRNNVARGDCGVVPLSHPTLLLCIKVISLCSLSGANLKCDFIDANLYVYDIVILL